MRLLVRLLKLAAWLAFAAMALLAGIGGLLALGVIKPATPKPPFPSVVVQAPKATVAAAAPRVEPPCALETPGLRNIPLFPDTASAQAMRDVVAAADGLRMLEKPGVFDVPVGTACAIFERGQTVSRVRVAAGERAGATGWIRSDWVREGNK